MITLQFSTEKGLSSALIRWFTWSRYSHVDVVLADNRGLYGARLSGGVDSRFPDYGQFTRIQRCTITLGTTAEDRFWNFLYAERHKPYDWRAILNFIFHRRHHWRETDSWFCSELVAAAFEYASEPLLQVEDVDRVTPRDLLISNLLHKEA